MNAARLPSADAYAKLLSLLVGEEVEVAVPSTEMPFAGGGLATFVGDDGKVAYLVATDLTFLAASGAALAMMPASVVNETLDAGRPPAEIVENAYEVMNVASSLFNELGPHVRIERLDFESSLPPKLEGVTNDAARLDVQVTISGYPTGQFAVFALP